MNQKYRNVWDEVSKRLQGIGKKDYVLHSRMVTRAMEEIIRGEGGNPDLLIPAAMLHDIGWSNVPKYLQFAKIPKDKKEAEKQHLEKAPDVIQTILISFEYNQGLIDKIIHVVLNHKSKNPEEDKEIECIVDADNLSDTFKESFYSDVISYSSTPQKTYDFRSKNKFFTKTAKAIFKRHLKARLNEIESGEAEKIIKQLQNSK